MPRGQILFSNQIFKLLVSSLHYIQMWGICLPHPKTIRQAYNIPSLVLSQPPILAEIGPFNSTLKIQNSPTHCVAVWVRYGQRAAVLTTLVKMVSVLPINRLSEVKARVS